MVKKYDPYTSPIDINGKFGVSYIKNTIVQNVESGDFLHQITMYDGFPFKRPGDRDKTKSVPGMDLKFTIDTIPNYISGLIGMYRSYLERAGKTEAFSSYPWLSDDNPKYSAVLTPASEMFNIPKHSPVPKIQQTHVSSANNTDSSLEQKPISEPIGTDFEQSDSVPKITTESNPNINSESVESTKTTKEKNQHSDTEENFVSDGSTTISYPGPVMRIDWSAKLKEWLKPFFTGEQPSLSVNADPLGRIDNPQKWLIELLEKNAQPVKSIEPSLINQFPFLDEGAKTNAFRISFDSEKNEV